MPSHSLSLLQLLLTLLIALFAEATPQWTANARFVAAFGSQERNFAQDVAIDSQNNTIVVGTFDGVLRVGSLTVSSRYPASFVAKTSPRGDILWLITSHSSPLKDKATSTTAYSVVVDPSDDSIVVGGSYAARDIAFVAHGREVKLRSYANFTSAYILKVSADGHLKWLRGPLALQLLYIKAVEVDLEGNVYVGGFFFGLVYLPPIILQSDGRIVQGWMAKFAPNGDLIWLTSMKGDGRTVIADMKRIDTGQIMAIGSYQSNCQVTTTTPNVNADFSVLLNGTASRSVVVASVNPKTGAWDWYQIASGEQSVTCEEYHYVDETSQKDGVYISGCFSNYLQFSLLPNNDTSKAQHKETLETGSTFNSIYIAKIFNNGSIGWTQAMLGANILDYDFAIRSVKHAHTTIRENDSGVIVTAFIQGIWDASTEAPRLFNDSKPILAASCPATQPQSVHSVDYGFEGNLGSLYAVSFDHNGCIAWIALIAYGRAQPGGVVPLHPNQLAMFGTFTGQVTFLRDGGAHSEKLVRSGGAFGADVFYAIVDIKPFLTLPSTELSSMHWQYAALAIFALLFLLASVCAICLYRPRAERLLLLNTDANRKATRKKRKSKRKQKVEKISYSSSEEDDPDSNQAEDVDVEASLLSHANDEDLGLAFDDNDEIAPVMGEMDEARENEALLSESSEDVE